MAVKIPLTIIIFLVSWLYNSLNAYNTNLSKTLILVCESNKESNICIKIHLKKRLEMILTLSALQFHMNRKIRMGYLSCSLTWPPLGARDDFLSPGTSHSRTRGAYLLSSAVFVVDPLDASCCAPDRCNSQTCHLQCDPTACRIRRVWRRWEEDKGEREGLKLATTKVNRGGEKPRRKREEALRQRCRWAWQR